MANFKRIVPPSPPESSRRWVFRRDSLISSTGDSDFGRMPPATVSRSANGVIPSESVSDRFINVPTVVA